MNTSNPTIVTLNDLFDTEISGFVHAEIQLKKFLTVWTNSVHSLSLKTILQKYQSFIEEHIQQLNALADDEKIPSIPLTNKVMSAFLEDAEYKLLLCADHDVKDACLLASIQIINHYKISSYGTGAAFANALEKRIQAGLLHGAEENEKEIDRRLTYLAEHEINIRATAPILLHQ